jgi:hypothetical protein
VRTRKQINVDSQSKEKTMSVLNGRVAVITGGNSGIGLATAKRFVKEGAYVFITGRRQAELDVAVSLIGKNVTAVQGDVSNLDDLDRLYEVVRKVKGRVDIVFANAGVVVDRIALPYSLCYLPPWISPLRAGGNDCKRILIKLSTVAAGSGISLLIRNISNFSFAPFKMWKFTPAVGWRNKICGPSNTPIELPHQTGIPTYRAADQEGRTYSLIRLAIEE